MLADRIRPGVLVILILFVVPCSALAQATTSTDAAIAELRQLLADQRRALDRAERFIDEDVFVQVRTSTCGAHARLWTGQL